jgi:plastocyanin
LRSSHRTCAVAALAVAALAPAAAAQAATKNVSLGLAKSPKGSPEAASYFDFFPAKVTIHAGDKVKYTNNAGFGLVYSGPKSKIQSIAKLDAASPVSGVTDPTGAPFWFNGVAPSASVNPEYLQKAGDGKVRKGQKDVDHDAISLGDAKPYTLSFAKPGTYKVYDALHPTNFNTVVVKAKGKKIPSKAADASAVVKQIAKRVAEAKKLEKLTPPANTLRIGNDSKKVGLYQFFPGNLTVAAGTPVTIDAGSRVDDIHDLAIGPQAYMQSIGQTVFSPGPNGVGLLASAVFPSQPSTAPLTFDGTQNGGFISTGAFDSDSSTPLPSKTTITFTKPGTYHYVCLFHSDGVNGMSGTITVQ